MEHPGSNQVVVAPMGFVLTDLAPWSIGCRDLCFAPQHMDYQRMLQTHHMVVDNSDRG